MGNKIISCTLSDNSLNKAIAELEAYRQSVEAKMLELCRKLADMGAVEISLGYARAIYDGAKDIIVNVEPEGNGYVILASGEALLFCEFGAGVTYGYGHPLAGELGMGPGTYPSDKGHWDDPNGWYIPKENGGGHTYGNPPNPVMYQTARDLERAIKQVAQEVFAS